jgi:GntR family transcriptional regulator of vanillate catabolism
MARGAPSSQMTRALLRLRELVLHGEFAPGERLSELPLVERLGVSRTPLRLALARLEHEGLIEALPGGGYAVRQFTRADVNEAIELRGVLEGTAARFAAERHPSRRAMRRVAATSDEIAEVVHTHTPSFESFVRYMTLNERFHRQLVELASSPVLTRALDGIIALPFASPSAALVAIQAELRESHEILIVSQSQHEALVQAIGAGEGTRAEGVAREHARMARLNLEVVMRHRDFLDSVPGGALVRLAAEDAQPAGETPVSARALPS